MCIVFYWQGRFKIKKKSIPRFKAPSPVMDTVDVECGPVQPTLEDAKVDTENDTEDDADYDSEDDTKEDEPKSDFRKWLENQEDEPEVKPRRRRKKGLGDMWMDFVEANLMQSVFCSTACGDFDDDTTAASSADSELDFEPYDLQLSSRRRSSKQRKRKSSRKPEFDY